MIISHTRFWRGARAAARAGTVAVTSILAVAVWAVWSPHIPPAHAVATDAGDLQVISRTGLPPDIDGVPIHSGGSETVFSLRLPAGAACPGDSANDNYRVQSYMVPASVDQATLTFGSDGPEPAGTGSDFRQPLYDYLFSPYSNAQTANATVVPGPGPIINIPTFAFTAFAPGDIPPGAYHVGVACTLGPSAATQMKTFWDIEMTFAADTADLPAGVTWTVAQTGTTTTAPPGATTTAPPGATTTTPPGATTTTPPGATTTTSRATTSTSRTGSSSSTPGGSSTTVGGGGPLARTGGSVFSLVAWSALLLILGRMVVLVVRTPGMRTGGRK